MTAAAPAASAARDSSTADGRPAMRGPHHNRESARRALHEHLGHTTPLALRQLVRLPHDPEHIQPVDTAPRLEFDQPRDAGLVDLSRGVEGRGGDRDDAPEIGGHVASSQSSETAL